MASFCIVPSFFPDSVNHKGPGGLPILRPDASHMNKLFAAISCSLIVGSMALWVCYVKWITARWVYVKEHDVQDASSKYSGRKMTLAKKDNTLTLRFSSPDFLGPLQVPEKMIWRGPAAIAAAGAAAFNAARMRAEGVTGGDRGEAAPAPAAAAPTPLSGLLMQPRAKPPPPIALDGAGGSRKHSDVESASSPLIADRVIAGGAGARSTPRARTSARVAPAGSHPSLTPPQNTDGRGAALPRASGGAVAFKAAAAPFRDTNFV